MLRWVRVVAERPLGALPMWRRMLSPRLAWTAVCAGLWSAALLGWVLPLLGTLALIVVPPVTLWALARAAPRRPWW